MLRRNFHSQLLEPYRTLVVQCAKKDLVHKAQNEIVAAAIALSISAAHFLEANSQIPGSTNAEVLRQKLQDVADTAKHGTLRCDDRTVTINTAYSYEFNDHAQFRFIRREVFANNRRYGEFQLVDTLSQYVSILSARFNLDFGPINPVVIPEPFLAEAGTVITPRTLDVEEVQIRFLKRTATGELVLADPPSGQIVIWQSGTGAT